MRGDSIYHGNTEGTETKSKAAYLEVTLARWDSAPYLADFTPADFLADFSLRDFIRAAACWRASFILG